MGYFDLEITVEPITAPGSAGYGRAPEEKVKLTFTITVKGNKHVKSYIVTEHAGMQLLKQIKLIKKAAQKVSVTVSGFTNLLQKAKQAVSSVNISIMRKKQ